MTKRCHIFFIPEDVVQYLTTFLDLNSLSYLELCSKWVAHRMGTGWKVRGLRVLCPQILPFSSLLANLMEIDFSLPEHRSQMRILRIAIQAARLNLYTLQNCQNMYSCCHECRIYHSSVIGPICNKCYLHLIFKFVQLLPVQILDRTPNWNTTTLNTKFGLMLQNLSQSELITELQRAIECVNKSVVAVNPWWLLNEKSVLERV